MTEAKREPEKTPAWMFVAGGLVLVGVVVFFVGRRKAPAPSASADNEVYAGMNAVNKAVMEAPEGATTCESAWNAFDALDKALAAQGQPSRVEKHPDKKTFLEVCEGFTGIEQQCLVPRFKGNNLDRCVREGQKVWSEEDAKKRKNLFTIFGQRLPEVGAPSAQKPTPP